MHLGGAWTALASWVLARRVGGKVILRVEDIDVPRVVEGSAARIGEDLCWLGLDWDEGPFQQSHRWADHQRAIALLDAKGHVYPCDCSRAEIARSASAPHLGEETVYPGTCSGRDPTRAMRRPPALRFRVQDDTVSFDDAVMGRVVQNLARDVGDFVIRRGDGVFAYQLAVVVDDLAMAVTDVVRGADLMASTPRQIALVRALGGSRPRYAHVPLVVDQCGKRLEKRTPKATIRALREAGVTAADIVGVLAHGLGLAPTNAPATPEGIAGALGRNAVAWRREPWTLPCPW